ncbi:MAG TPA: SUMF1/EgtB/PvdO family nonheme iron enzyme [Prolixibacteraceae bacterium]|nr:SUMF1/EgtB/PvdO family nonheme iron enzyme [Prolixibacteraceae bacterium]
MLKKFGSFLRKHLLLVLFVSFAIGIMATISGNKTIEYTSTDEFCASCHVHPHVFTSWKLSTHFDNKGGIQVHCVDCHLPPKGEGYLLEKTKLGLWDVYQFMTKDSADFNWEAKRTVEKAPHFTFKASCVKCHANLFPLTLNKEGQDAHLYYTQNEATLECTNCHLNVGHYDPNAKHASNSDFGKGSGVNQIVYSEPTKVEKFTNFTEKIPASTISFNMIAIPGGKFKIGSPESEPYRRPDEGPVKEIEVSPFFMAEVEVTWNEFLVFYRQTGREGRTSDTKSAVVTEAKGASAAGEVDAISGPTPPYGQPDQNWGLGSRPAITMRYATAETYCKWLTMVTGKKYRLPTEAEWEYACRAGTQSPYFFEGDPKKYSKNRLMNKIFGADTTNINRYIIYSGNSMDKTQKPEMVKPNPFGLKNMLGNVAEFCSDWYASDAYSTLNDGVKDPKGPASGTEKVIRGGSFKSEPTEVRCAARDFTQNEAWMRTDPQIPKSVWWYSDCNMVGFRVVCELDETTGK